MPVQRRRRPKNACVCFIFGFDFVVETEPSAGVGDGTYAQAWCINCYTYVNRILRSHEHVAVSKSSQELVALAVAVLRERRESLNVSKKSLAAEAGVSRTAIILMESERRLPSLELVIKIAMGLGLSFSEVIAEAEKRMARKMTRKRQGTKQVEPES